MGKGGGAWDLGDGHDHGAAGLQDPIEAGLRVVHLDVEQDSVRAFRLADA